MTFNISTNNFVNPIFVTPPKIITNSRFSKVKEFLKKVVILTKSFDVSKILSPKPLPALKMEHVNLTLKVVGESQIFRSGITDRNYTQKL